MKKIRWFFGFGYGFKKVELGIKFGDELKDDLVGYGYDVPPILRCLKVNILFLEFTIGNLIII